VDVNESTERAPESGGYTPDAAPRRAGQSARRAGADTRVSGRESHLKALEEARRRFEQLVENTDCLFWICEWPSRQAVYVSPASEQIAGLRPEEIYADKGAWPNRIHPEDREWVQSAMERAVATGVFNEEYRLLLPGGAVKWVHEHARGTKDETGQILRLSGVTQDITARKQAEDALRESEERYHALVTATAEVVFHCDTAGRLAYLSSSWCELTGQSLEEARGKGSIEQVHPDDRERAATLWRTAVRTGNQYRAELRVRMADETYRYFDVRAVPVRDAQGKIREWIGVSVDIDERKQAERQLLIHQERLGLAQRAGESGAFEWDIISGRNVWSPSLEELFGMQPGEFGGTYEGWLACVLPEDREVAHYANQEALKTGIFKGEWRIRRRNDGQVRWIRAQGKVFFDQQGRPERMIGINFDITERKSGEQQLLQAHDELEGRVRERTRELNAANHSLRELTARLLETQDHERRRVARDLHDSAGQILNALGINLALLADSNSGLPAPKTKLLVECEKLVRQLSGEIGTISHLLHPPLLDEAGLGLALRAYVQGFSERSKIAVKLDIDPDLSRLGPEIETAVFRIVQECLTNLYRHSGSATAAIRLLRSPGAVSVEVKDHGKGIPPDKLSAGTDGAAGVGIRGMRERVRQLGGVLEISSDDGGTAVHVHLPVSGAAAATG
jgi:PAS domain S-box-containing protein